MGTPQQNRTWRGESTTGVPNTQNGFTGHGNPGVDTSSTPFTKLHLSWSDSHHKYRLHSPDLKAKRLCKRQPPELRDKPQECRPSRRRTCHGLNRCAARARPVWPRAAPARWERVARHQALHSNTDKLTTRSLHSHDWITSGHRPFAAYSSLLPTTPEPVLIYLSYLCKKKRQNRKPSRPSHKHTLRRLHKQTLIHRYILKRTHSVAKEYAYLCTCTLTCV